MAHATTVYRLHAVIGFILHSGHQTLQAYHPR
jgi:hypothetical protein